ncbi:MAG: hypothetical protein HN842_00915 [Gammaproteobacteria bacterium]|jgi:hypothetical protein|nr:hypothetical protein [Gammaproteobacteria bacterium]
MNKNFFGLAAAAALAVPMTATAGQAEMEQTLRSLEAQISALKAEMASMKGSQKSSDSAEWTENVSFNGVVEFDYIDSDNAEGNFELSTMELGVQTQLSDRVSSGMIVKSENGNDLFIDELTVTLSGGDLPALTVGKFSAPFGAYETHMIADSLTKGDGETSSLRAVMVETAVGGVDVALYTGSGDSNRDEDVSGIALGMERGDLALGAGWIDNVKESGSSAWTANMGYSMGDISLIGEYLDVDNAADTTVLNVEMGYNFAVSGREATVALGYGNKEETATADVTQAAGVFVVGIAEGTTAAIEYINSDTGATDVDTMTARIAYEF